MRFLLLFALLLICASAQAQEIYLQLEKRNSAKTRKFVRGDAFEYRTTDDPDWQVGRLEQLVPEENLVVFQNRLVALDQITDLRDQSPRRWSTPAGGSLIAFGATWGVLSLISGVVDRENDPLEVSDAVVAAGSAALGYGLMRLFRYRRFDLGKRHRLRIVDLRALRPGVTN